MLLCEARWRGHRLPNESDLELVCGGGYYVRALARDLGRALGCGAHLRSLHRNEIGPWRDPGEERVWIHGRGLLPWLPSRKLDADEALAIEQGRPIPAGQLAAPEWPLPAPMPAAPAPVRAVHRDALVALLEPRGDQLAPTMQLRGGL